MMSISDPYSKVVIPFPQKKKEQKKFFHALKGKLSGLKEKLEEADKAMKRGEVELEDLAWEDEFNGHLHKRR